MERHLPGGLLICRGLWIVLQILGCFLVRNNLLKDADRLMVLFIISPYQCFVYHRQEKMKTYIDEYFDALLCIVKRCCQ